MLTFTAQIMEKRLERTECVRTFHNLCKTEKNDFVNNLDMFCSSFCLKFRHTMMQWTGCPADEADAAPHGCCGGSIQVCGGFRVADRLQRRTRKHHRFIRSAPGGANFRRKREPKMQDIANTVAVYERLRRRHYHISIEGDIEFTLAFKPENYHHLAGLHYLTDVDFVCHPAVGCDRFYRIMFFPRLPAGENGTGPCGL